MSPEERQLLTQLFDRVRSQANAPRDRDAENLIADSVRAQPYAPYLLAQAVLVQEQALHGADQKIQDLQAQIAQLQEQAQAAPQGGGSFLGGLFGGGAARPAQPAAGPSPWGAAPQQQQYAPPPGPGPGPSGYGPAGPSPWGAPQQPQGGGFLRNAMGAAAGVAGGVLLADSFRGLFGGGNNAGSGLLGGSGLGSVAGLGGGAGLGSGLGSGLGGGETVVNNFFDKPNKDQGGATSDSSNADDSGLSDADFTGDDDYFGGDDYDSDV